ncbi:transcription-associated protein 1 isoform X2 [Phlebotomus papatasi]|nr:transcription-associated protein 1 isoform X2 [Phlebotomus papatasi]
MPPAYTGMIGGASTSSTVVDSTQMNVFRSYVSMLADPMAKEEVKLKAAQELSENFEIITQCSGYQSFLEHAMKIFIKVLQDGEPQFISENNIQQVRKLILEMIHRLPTSEVLRPYVKVILTLMLKLLREDNEENVLVCLRIIIELHKQYRPAYNPEIGHFLAFVKNIYSELPKHMAKIFEPRAPIRVKDLKELNMEQLLAESYTITPIQVEKKTADGTTVTQNLIPKGVLSLKVLQELPIIVVLMYQIYKTFVHQEVAEFVPLIMTTITLQPSPIHRQSPAFNKEVFVDFMGAQIKTLSFLAYIIRLFTEVIVTHSASMVKGMLSLLQLCPKEVAHLRKELLIAARHILATELRNKFVGLMDKLFNEDLLLGRGYTTHESLRPLAYSTLADLTHHVRQNLSLPVLAKAVHLFSKNVHDESLPTSIQTMSCKLLLNLVDCIRQRSDTETSTARDLLITMLKVFTLKFQTIAKIQLPQIMKKCAPNNRRPIKPDESSSPTNSGTPTQANPPALTAPDTFRGDSVSFDVPMSDQPTKLGSIGFPPPPNLNVAEYRSLVKTLVCGVKTITWGCAGCKSPLSDCTNSSQQSKVFQPSEILIFIDLVQWALEALDIYMINVPTVGPSAGQMVKTVSQVPRSKEEKEVLEHFSGVFLMNNQNFQEIFASTIDFMVERLHENPALQVIANSFLANSVTSPLFATVLVEYLLERMEGMGSSVERSNLYLRLFKLVFGSVSLFPAENEHMLRPHLHNIVNRSMELAMTAKEPYNYFLLLRALFRSIGGGNHDLLYQEFLPLLPNLLEGLNRLQSGFHKQHMKDLFVELCLTVPVRLSSLLPYLPMLMDPLVSALNGSHTLISQGLRTLELCVDNLQPDFLYDHIQPVRAELMQALWRTLRNQDSAALVAFRVLGKFGGGNRKMMIEPQRLEYNDKDTPAPAIMACFQDNLQPVDFPMDKVIETAFSALKSSSTDPFYWKQSWEAIRCYLAASLSLDDDKHTLQKLFMHPSFVEGNIGAMPAQQYRALDSQARQTHQTALTGMFVAAATKDLRESVLPTMVAVVRHYTMVAIAQQAGPFPHKYYQMNNGLDPLVLIDALAAIMGHEEKELCKPGRFAMVLILQTATSIMGTKERACRLPMMQYLAEQMCNLCYERPWYAKMGGCDALKFLYQHMAMRWLYQHLFVFLKAFMFVIMDLAGEVSSGAIDTAKTNLEEMLRICMVPLDKECKNEELITTQDKAMKEVIQELVRQVTSPHTLVREQAMSSLKLIAELQGKTVTDIMEPHREVLVDMIPPKKHLLRHQPTSAQIGLMDGNTFCTTLEPRLFTIDFAHMTHKVFFHELVTLCKAEDNILNKLDCYKNVTNLVPLRKSALRALAAFHYITAAGYREEIFKILFTTLEKNNPELQEAAFECMQKFIAGFPIEKEIVYAGMKSLLTTLGDYRNLTLSGVKSLSYLTQLFPSMFNEKLCEQLLQHIRKLLEHSIASNKSTDQNFLAVAKTGETEQKITTIIGIFHQIPAASSKFVDCLCRLVLQTEKTIIIESSSPYREPLVKFLLRYPKETLDLLLSEANVKDPQWNRFLIYLLKHKDGAVFRLAMEAQAPQLVALILTSPFDQGTSQMQAAQLPQQQMPQPQFYMDRYESLRQAVLIVHTLTQYDDRWLATQPDIIHALKTLWANDLYKTCEASIVCDLWHLVAKILLHYFSHHTHDIDLLFQLLRALCLRFIPDFQFLRDFLQNVVAQSYTVDWKRKAFFYFVDNFNNPNISLELKAKILTCILIPSFAVSFEKGEGNKLVGAPPTPYQEDDNNVVSVFIMKVIDHDNPYANDDAVRIALLQFACLLVERASSHIHDGDANNKKQSNKLRRLMTFAWPCLLVKSCVDPAARYHGHLLLSHIIARLAIHKRIVLQVFHSLLKGHAIEARSVVRQALEVLTPAMPLRMEDGNTMLNHWTRKIIVEEGHSMQQLFHILQLVVRHYKVYYPVRHHLVQHMINSIQRLGFAATATVEYRKLSVELAEVIIKWELQRIKEENDDTLPAEDEEASGLSDSKLSQSGAIKRTSQEEHAELARKKQLMTEAGPSTQQQPVVPKVEGANRPIDRVHCDTVLNFLMRLACQVHELNTQPGQVSAGESLSRRCVTLLKMAMKPEVWPQPCDLKLAWLDKVFASVETQQPNFGNICTALELLTFLLTVMKKDQILTTFRPLQRGLSVCVNCTNTKVIRLMHSLLAKLMSLFPTDSHHKYEELETLYATVNKMICEGLSQYEKSQQANPSTLFGTLMILKAACMNNQSYIDRLMVPFMRLLNRLTKDHLAGCMAPPNAGQPEVGLSPVALELLILSLDLVKNRVVVMGVEMRKVFIGNILVGLIEKSTDVKVMKAIVKMIEEWMRHKNTPITVTQAPTLREKSILLVKLMHFVEKRFAEDQELNAQFLELINYIYRDDQLKQTELTSKLEAAFVAGLRCNQPHIRAKFVEVFDGSMRRRMHDRLLYIVCSQAWDSIGQHYWIKQCIELLILTVNSSTQIQNANESHLLPSVSSVINLADSDEKKNFVIFTSFQNDPQEQFDTIEDKEDAFDMDMSVESTISRREESERPVANRQTQLVKLINRQSKFLEASRKIRTEQLLVATSQLCHMDTQLAERVWLDMFPRIWTVLDEEHQNSLAQEFLAFLSSGTHNNQKDCHPSAMNTFVEALTRCQPPIVIPPHLMTYLGKAHNLWHRMTLMLENMAQYWPQKKESSQQDISEANLNNFYGGEFTQQDVYDPLSQMYSVLQEEDLWAGLWLKYAKYPETNNAIAYEQMGFFEEAQNAYDIAMSKLKTDMANGPVAFDINNELLLWENHWIRCAKELNQWDLLLDYAQSNKDKNFMLIMESAWRVPDWNLMEQALLKVEQSCPKQASYKVNLYRGFLTILNLEKQRLNSVETYVEMASKLCMREWRRLPHIVSHIHLPILQVAQQIMELQEANQIHQGLQQVKMSSSLHDMKAIVKTWRNRLPVIADDLSHWSDIFTWRQHHYQIITDHLKQQTESGNNMLGVHASAQAIIHFGKIARKHNLRGVCQDSLSRIYTIPQVPIVDCFQKIKQQVKCYLQMAAVSGRNELNEAVEVIESTNFKYFNHEMSAEFYAFKGLLLAQIGRSEDANKEFSAAVQMHDTQIKAWALWGDYLEHVFTTDTNQPRNMQNGLGAMTCFLHACRHQNEFKSRKYLAKVLWLLSYDDKSSSLMEILEKYSVGVPPLHWIPWIPQLLCALVQYEGTVILNLLSQVGRMFPQAVYFPIRTLYLTLKIEQRERYKNAEQANLAAACKSQQQGQSQTGAVAGGTPTGSEASPSQMTVTAQPGTSQATGGTDQPGPGPFKATPPMWRCSKIMHHQRDIHPTTLSSLEGIVDQMVWFRENWYEEVLRQLRQGLTKCYVIAFENRGSVNEATITPHTLNFVKKLVSTFGIGIADNRLVCRIVENISSSVASTFASAASESLAKRAQATVQDPVFQKMKGQFTSDFDFSQPGAMKLHNLISKLKKWIKILEAKTKQLPKVFLIEEKCRFLSNFSQKTAEVELPGEVLGSRPSHYHIRIARFMPRVEVVQKHNTAARRLSIRGTNGKIYKYLVVNDSGLGDARREERVLQLLRMLNHYLAKQKETARRFLNITVHRVVAVSPQMRLVEDNPTSISLLDIYKNGCAKMKIEHDTPIARYYERLAEVQCRGSQTTHPILRDILREIQQSMVPKTILKDWAVQCFRSATDYWQFRKMFTLQLSLACLCEHALHLTRINPDMMYLHQDSGLINISYFKFDVDDVTGELDASRPVPFRLTPNIVEFLSSIGITGPLTASAMVTARCFVQPNFKLPTILRTILKDEIMAVHKKRPANENPSIDPNGDLSSDKGANEVDMEKIITIVNKGVNSIMSRLNNLSYFESVDTNKMGTLVQAALNPDNLCRMDPAWHPWM